MFVVIDTFFFFFFCQLEVDLNWLLSFLVRCITAAILCMLYVFIFCENENDRVRDSIEYVAACVREFTQFTLTPWWVASYGAASTSDWKLSCIRVAQKW